jgi:hypothetical protein
MNIPACTQRFRKTTIVLLLLSIAQWSYDGVVLCYGADGHIEIELPAAKDCCKKNKPAVAVSSIAQFDVEHCTDIPLDLQKRISATRHPRPSLSCLPPVCFATSLPASVSRSCGMLLSFDLPPPHPLAVSLKTVVLLI